jgi:hypothetical protein
MSLEHKEGEWVVLCSACDSLYLMIGLCGRALLFSVGVRTSWVGMDDWKLSRALLQYESGYRGPTL